MPVIDTSVASLALLHSHCSLAAVQLNEALIAYKEASLQMLWRTCLKLDDCAIFFLFLYGHSISCCLESKHSSRGVTVAYPPCKEF